MMNHVYDGLAVEVCWFYILKRNNMHCSFSIFQMNPIDAVRRIYELKLVPELPTELF